MKALVIGACWADGADDFYAALAADHELVVAADAAAERLLALGTAPDIACGDFDSAEPGAAERLEDAGVAVRTYAAEKDETDLDLALDAARAAGATSVTFTGAFRGRLDHTLAALGTMAAAADLAATAIEPDLHIWVVDGAACPVLELALAPGTLVSVVAFGTPPTGVTLSGMRYPLAGATLSPLSGLGVSNVAEGSTQIVTLSTGTLLVLSVS